MPFWKKKKPTDETAAPYSPLTPPEEEPTAPDAATEPVEPTEPMVILPDGRTFTRAFYEEIRTYDAPDLRVILDEQKDLYTPEEYAYIEEVFAERLGDIH